MQKHTQKALWHPVNMSRKRKFLEARDQILQALRGYFTRERFFAVETPALQISPGLEPHLAAFATRWQSPTRNVYRDFYLHTSPEFAMKKLLVAGWERIYQVAHVFRNREASSTHHPEFAMLEWYRSGSDYFKIMQDCEELLRACAAVSPSGLCTWQGKTSDPQKGFERLTVQEAFLAYTKIDLLATLEDPQRLAEAATGLGIRCQATDRWDDIFFRIFLDHIEPKLGIGRPTILYDYPISMAALARPKASDPRLAERFELYICGLELANAFSELTDARVQRERFAADMDLKERLYGERYPVDPEFLAALEFGLPECAGIALGVDRLVMLLTGAACIEDVLWLPVDLAPSP